MTDAYHITPVDDLKEHIDTSECWCKPTKDEEEDLYIHHSMDQRELYESGDVKMH